MRECLERIEEREGELRAWAHLDPEQAIAQARARDEEEPRGPLHGLPVGVKDVIDTADMPTSYGSPIYAGRRPARDADCVDVAARAGRGDPRQDGDDRVRHLRAAADRQPARPRAHAGRLLERLGRRGRGRDGPARLRHADRRLGDPPRVVLRRRRLQAPPRLALDRRHQAPQRAPRHARDVRPHGRRRRAAGRLRAARAASRGSRSAARRGGDAGRRALRGGRGGRLGARRARAARRSSPASPTRRRP